MKIAIFGSYNGGSMGDTAILLGLISSINRVVGHKVEIVLFALGEININNELKNINQDIQVLELLIRGVPKNNHTKFGYFTQRIMSYLKRIIFGHNLNVSLVEKELSKCDLLLIGGGNLLMDLYPGWTPILKKICEIAFNQKIPYHFVGVGAGPIDTIKGAENLKWCLKRSKKTFLRDDQSKVLLEKKYNLKHLRLGPDLAFGIFTDFTFEKKKDKIAINAASVYSKNWPIINEEKYKNYIQGLAGALKFISKKLSVQEVVVFNTNYPLDCAASVDLVDELKKNNDSKLSIDLIEGRQAVGDILNICSSCKYSLVTRLHAGIISSLAGAFVFAIAYQPKVSDVLMHQVKNAFVDTFESTILGNSFEGVRFEQVASSNDSNGDLYELVDLMVYEIFN